MKKRQPKTVSKLFDRELIRDAGFLFIACCFVLVQGFDYSWVEATMYSPPIVLALGIGLYLLIQVLWVLMLGVDKFCDRFGLHGHH